MGSHNNSITGNKMELSGTRNVQDTLHFLYMIMTAHDQIDWLIEWLITINFVNRELHSQATPVSLADPLVQPGHWSPPTATDSFPPYYTIVGGLYPVPPLKLTHWALTNQWHSEVVSIFECHWLVSARCVTSDPAAKGTAKDPEVACAGPVHCHYSFTMRAYIIYSSKWYTNIYCLSCK